MSLHRSDDHKGFEETRRECSYKEVKDIQYFLLPAFRIFHIEPPHECVLDIIEPALAQKRAKSSLVEIACVVTIDARFTLREFLRNTEQIETIGSCENKPPPWFQVGAHTVEEKSGVGEMLNQVSRENHIELFRERKRLRAHPAVSRSVLGQARFFLLLINSHSQKPTS